jgi:23S rRNA pseudouridine2605 synthase
MDKNTTGLLFTNDTDMLRKFTLPSQNHLKYIPCLDKKLKFEDSRKINKGLTLDGHRVFSMDYIEGEAKSEIGLKLRSANVKLFVLFLNISAMMF